MTLTADFLNWPKHAPAYKDAIIQQKSRLEGQNPRGCQLRGLVIRIGVSVSPCNLFRGFLVAPDSERGIPQSFAAIVASLPTLVQSSKGDADGRRRPGFMMLSGSSPALIAATASTPSGEISSVSHGRCSVPTAW
jgi:hypothetical protein